MPKNIDFMVGVQPPLVLWSLKGREPIVKDKATYRLRCGHNFIWPFSGLCMWINWSLVMPKNIFSMLGILASLMWLILKGSQSIVKDKATLMFRYAHNFIWPLLGLYMWIKWSLVMPKSIVPYVESCRRWCFGASKAANRPLLLRWLWGSGVPITLFGPSWAFACE